MPLEDVDNDLPLVNEELSDIEEYYDIEGGDNVVARNGDLQADNQPPAVPKRAPGRPRIERTGLRGRPRKLFHTRDADARGAEAEFAMLSEIPMK